MFPSQIGCYLCVNSHLLSWDFSPRGSRRQGPGAPEPPGEQQTRLYCMSHSPATSCFSPAMVDSLVRTAGCHLNLAPLLHCGSGFQSPLSCYPGKPVGASTNGEVSWGNHTVPQRAHMAFEAQRSIGDQPSDMCPLHWLFPCLCHSPSLPLTLFPGISSAFKGLQTQIPGKGDGY